MKVKEIFDLGLKVGMATDPRGMAGVKRHLAKIKKNSENLKPSDKEYFDTELLTNPYADCAIHVDDKKTEVKRILTGIDISSSEILLASQLNERGQKIDLVIAHHPIGKALACLHDVMDMIVEVYENHGVPVHIAEKIFDDRVGEVGRNVHGANHFEVVDMAKLLKVNLINTHTITDNLVNNFLIEFFAKKKPQTVGEIVEALLEIPEYKEAQRMSTGPKIIAGSAKHRSGKIMVDMTGGTSPSSKVYQELSHYGISTLVGMHMRDDSMKQANEHHMNVIIAGHMASDSLGMNLFLDELEKKGIEIVPCGGLMRVSRNKKK